MMFTYRATPASIHPRRPRGRIVGWTGNWGERINDGGGGGGGAKGEGPLTLQKYSSDHDTICHDLSWAIIEMVLPLGVHNEKGLSGQVNDVLIDSSRLQTTSLSHSSPANGGASRSVRHVFAKFAYYPTCVEVKPGSTACLVVDNPNTEIMGTNSGRNANLQSCERLVSCRYSPHGVRRLLHLGLVLSATFLQEDTTQSEQPTSTITTRMLVFFLSICDFPDEKGE